MHAYHYRLTQAHATYTLASCCVFSSWGIGYIALISLKVSFSRDDCTQTVEAVDFLRLFSIHLYIDVHFFAVSVRHDIVLLRAHFRAICMPGISGFSLFPVLESFLCSTHHIDVVCEELLLTTWPFILIVLAKCSESRA